MMARARSHGGSVLVKVARTSSLVTHSHPLAIQGAILQAGAVAAALQGLPLGQLLAELARLLPDSSPYHPALAAMADGLQAGRRPSELVESLGTGIDAKESVPMAIYCFLANPDNYEQVIQDALFLGGDTDTIASMAGSISGARLGLEAIPGAGWPKCAKTPTSRPHPPTGRVPLPKIPGCFGILIPSRPQSGKALRTKQLPRSDYSGASQDSLPRDLAGLTRAGLIARRFPDKVSVIYILSNQAYPGARVTISLTTLVHLTGRLFR